MSETLWIGKLVVGEVETNCYLLKHDEGGNEAVLIDPGDEAERILAALKKQGAELKAIFITHGHYDHTGAVLTIKNAFPSAALYALEAEKELIENPSLNASFLEGAAISPDVYLKDGEVLELIGKKIRVIASPGHTAGSMCLYLEEDGMLFAGDTIFFSGYGRTDLPTGDADKMYHSLEMLLTGLPEETKVYPGHGPATTIGRERSIEGF